MFYSMIPCLKDVRGNCGDGGDVSGDGGGDGGGDGKERMRVRESVEKVVRVLNSEVQAEPLIMW